eukprot:2875212-Rhodomonas_salina.1
MRTSARKYGVSNAVCGQATAVWCCLDPSLSDEQSLAQSRGKQQEQKVSKLCRNPWDTSRKLPSPSMSGSKFHHSGGKVPIAPN